jgi:hypothetical protein
VALVQGADIGLSKKAINIIMANIEDTDDDGLVSYEEFVPLRCHPHMPPTPRHQPPPATAK